DPDGELPEGEDDGDNDLGNVTEGGTDVYAVEMDNGKELLFNSEGTHLHTALIDSEDDPVLDVVDIPQGIKDWVATNSLGGIYDVYRELSVEEGSESFIYWVDFEDSLTAIFDSEGQLINAHYEDDDHQEGEGEHHGEDGEEHPEGGDPSDATDPNYTGGPGEGPDGEDPDGEHPEDGGPEPADGGDSGTDVYAVELDNGKELFFNVVGEHLHTALIDSQDGPALDAVDIPQGIMDWVASNALSEIYNVYKELSVEEGPDSFIYWVDFENSLTAIFDSEGQFINAHYEDDDHQEGEGEHPGEDGEGHPEGGDPTDPTDPNYTGEPGEGPDSEGPDGEHPEDGGDSGTDVYAVELDNGKELFFNVDGEHLHTALIDSQDGPALDVVDIPDGITEWVETNTLGGIYDVYREHSVEEGPESFIYWVDFEDGLTAMFDQEGELINAHYEGHGQGGEGDGAHPKPWEPEKWKPFELPENVKNYLLQEYPGIHFWADEVDGPDGVKEIIVFLDNGLDATFDSDGNHLKTVDPWEEKLQNVTPGLKLSTTSSTWATADGSSSGAFTLDATTGIYSSSGGGTPAYAALQYEANTGADATGSDTVEPVEGEEGEGDDVAAPAEEDFHQGSRLYTLVFTNTQPGDSAPSAAEGNLASTDLVAGTTLSLTFTYEFGPIRYIGLNGAELTSFTHTEPDWENDGSFTITVKTVNPPASTSDPDGTVVESSFGMIVEMGGEYWYDGAIFMTDVFWSDMSQPKYTSPWEPVAAFNIAGQDGAAANFTAYLPINLIQGQFEVWRPQDLSAAVLKSDGSMAFIAGSTDDGSMPTTGSSWTLTPYEGERPGPGQPAGGGPVELAASFIDFNGNGHKDPLLVVSFSNDSWSDADIQLGDPFMDPYANLDKSSYGSISGTISATDGSFPPDYDVWLIEAIEDSNDPYEGKPAFMEYEAGDNGTYTIKVGPGTYYLEAVAFDFENDIPYKPRMHRDESGNPLALTITDSTTNHPDINFSIKQEFRQTGGRGKVKGRIVNADGQPVREANIEVFPVDDEGEILSDHPVGNGWVEPNGSYMLEAPSGLMKLIISTWDNSFTAQESTITIPANGELTGQDFTMAARGAGTVTGSITDADDNPVWAEVIFIDAGDEDRFVWPKEFLMEKIAGEITGNYTATIPAGEYKIYVKRWDGALLPAYYSVSAVTGADDFDEATTVTVGENATSTGISIQLQARPTATVTFKVLNSADNTNVADAFVAFTDSEDEWGGVFFPHLEVSEDGTHTVKAPGGK
ncbi:MAG: PepSY-like domain-containing protein, partial [Opitutales bacterium]|nr:PepSY-like domain-containing protein [Opitutales bacterium]